MRRSVRDTRTFKVLTDPLFWPFVVIGELALIGVMYGLYQLAEALR